MVGKRFFFSDLNVFGDFARGGLTLGCDVRRFQYLVPIPMQLLPNQSWYDMYIANTRSIGWFCRHIPAFALFFFFFYASCGSGGAFFFLRLLRVKCAIPHPLKKLIRRKIITTAVSRHDLSRQQPTSY